YVLDATFLFNTREEAYAKLDGEPGRILLDGLEKINLKGLGFTENGFRNLTANKQILQPDDLRGLKVRVMENKIQMLTWSSLGGNPTPVAFGELFTALQQGTVDAQENPFELIYTNKFYEVQNYVMTTNHLYMPMVTFINLDYYNDLSPEHQALIHRAAEESIAIQRRAAKANEDKAIAAIRDSIEIVDLTPEQRRAFQEKMGPVYDEVRAQVGNDELMRMFLDN
ncbi:MAG: DctP family TRAP transporter solute-binding subunit, partial [Planctomycetes bacterium]|nr:DctP family TRAP transporter solute-binding subunit [Planctomycetota bacterium]